MHRQLGFVWKCVALTSMTVATRSSLADDLGYGDLGCYTESNVPTPYFDRLATEEMRFIDAHSPSTVCTPSRYRLLTGRMCFRAGLRGVLTGVDGPLFERGRRTLGSMLRQQGCATACVGQWHVGMNFFQQDGKQVAPLREEFGYDSARPRLSSNSKVSLAEVKWLIWLILG